MKKHTSSAPDSTPPSWMDSIASIYLDSGSNMADDNASFLMIFPYSIKETENSISREIKENDRRAVWKLSDFLGTMKEFHGASCLQQPPTHNNESDLARNISLDASWCRFITKSWSVHIRNTGAVQNVQLRKSPTVYPNNNMTEVEMILVQSCNILQGPFLIRKDVFNRIGGLLDSLGKLTLLEFFLRSKGELKMAKLTNCVWTPDIARANRGTLEGSNSVPEYATFANKHKILRIVTESRIEWTACVANWKLCTEKPYVKPRDLPGIASPICCSAVLGKMLKDFKSALDTLGLEYRIVYGTLLGAVRSQAIIPWTQDVDIAVPKSAFLKASTYSSLQKLLGSRQYYVGESFLDMPRGHMLSGPSIEINTTSYFEGPDDLEGNALFSNELEEAVKDMLPVSQNWKARCYVDLYQASDEWMEESSLITINNEQFVTLTVKDVDYQLTSLYGKNYRQPEVKGNWSGLH
ncbi:hypothetical protein OS493_006299 [Desmophyllum pertusum]|uniref:LicD/FKTN/FKRP nucleotidyltransferase domain-containing protein n=1 Tax=Desmophyllum pertusum TaxID=174260 RepID=A0A9X0DCT3_9CNID|nr:hypothetical protein OS493_006299 [Desmophyllum pertusum]